MRPTRGLGSTCLVSSACEATKSGKDKRQGTFETMVYRVSRREDMSEEGRGQQRSSKMVETSARDDAVYIGSEVTEVASGEQAERTLRYKG